MSESKTPRTDAIVDAAGKDSGPRRYVPQLLELSRTLERELTTALTELAAYKAAERELPEEPKPFGNMGDPVVYASNYDDLRTIAVASLAREGKLEAEVREMAEHHRAEEAKFRALLDKAGREFEVLEYDVIQALIRDHASRLAAINKLLEGK